MVNYTRVKECVFNVHPTNQAFNFLEKGVLIDAANLSSSYNFLRDSN